MTQGAQGIALAPKFGGLASFSANAAIELSAEIGARIVRGGKLARAGGGIKILVTCSPNPGGLTIRPDEPGR
jgi:hypothetical protein